MQNLAGRWSAFSFSKPAKVSTRLFEEFEGLSSSAIDYYTWKALKFSNLLRTGDPFDDFLSVQRDAKES